jgi:hypothetical protein
MLQAYRRSAKVAQTVPMRDNLQERVVFWGMHNTFPEQVRQWLMNSGTAYACVDKLTTFLYGQGVTDSSLANLKMNDAQDLDDFFHAFTQQTAVWNACAIHITTNMLGQPIEYRIVTYYMVRKGVEDSEYHNKYLISNNWNYQAPDWYKNNEPVIIDEFSFNALENIEKIKACEGEHKGFILEFRLDKQSVYPLPSFMSVIEDVKADLGASQYRASSAQNGFNPSAVFVVDGVNILAEDFINAIQGAQGSDNAGRAVVIEGGKTATNGKFEKQIDVLQPTINKDITTEQEQAAKLKIINNYQQPKFLHTLDDGAMFSQSGEAIQTAYKLYNQTTSRQRRKIAGFIDDLVAMLPNSEDLPIFEINELTFNASPNV